MLAVPVGATSVFVLCPGTVDAIGRIRIAPPVNVLFNFWVHMRVQLIVPLGVVNEPCPPLLP